jgi:hypothetical protein
MKRSLIAFFLLSAAAGLVSGLLLVKAQEPVESAAPAVDATAGDNVEGAELPEDHAQCDLFGARRERYLETGLAAEQRRRFSQSKLTDDVVKRLSASINLEFVPGGSRTNTYYQLDQMGVIDRHIFGGLQEAGVAPAERVDDFGFIRRVTLDLTGRIPTVEALIAFVSDADPEKRRRLVENLTNTTEWVDKWTMYLGDLYKNRASLRATANVNRFAQGRDAFHRWIRTSLESGKPYNLMVQELIGGSGVNSWQQGELNWLVGGRVTGGPVQDIYDQQAANTAETFLGMAHVNCILCHDGRRHLDELSLWGKSATRYSAYQFASHFSHTALTLTRPDPNNRNLYYWSVLDDTPRVLPDYTLNTRTGNRPNRTQIGTAPRVAAAYLNGNSPRPGENRREFLARELTADIQFARAAVNYIWKEFMGRGLVEPLNQFDLARLDPDNPPPAPWTLQPSNARLLNALAQDFVESGYSLKDLMRKIASSEAYQLSARYNGEWKPEYQNLFARKLVRRLWSEELHDSLIIASNITPTYRIGDLTFQFAMKFPDTVSVNSTFLNNFFRGNRDEEPRKTEGSIFQAMSLMNDRFVNDRAKASGTGPNASLLMKYRALPDNELVDNLFLTVLSRYPSAQERLNALESLRPSGSITRNQKAEHLLWSLYNKVDFIYNY